MSKYYKMIVTEINEETGEEKEISNEEFNGFTVLADCHDNPDRMCEMMIHENIAGLAGKLAEGKKTKHAVKLAALILEMQKAESDREVSAMESFLSDIISNGGIQ